MSMMVVRLVVGIEGIVFAALLLYIAAALSSRFAKNYSVGTGAILGLTTAWYILALIWSIAVHRLQLTNPLTSAAAFAIGLLVGNLIFGLIVRGKHAQ